MPLSNVHAVTLARHPTSPDGAVRDIEARVRRASDGTLAIAYAIEGNLAHVHMPPPGPARVTHGLWQHTCCECFIALEGESGYHEFNFAPSGEWAVYAFSKYREGTALADEALTPRITVRSLAGRLELTASIRLERLSAAHARGRLAVGLSAVIEDEQGMLSYWALRHPAGKPDFHLRDSFILEIEGL